MTEVRDLINLTVKHNCADGEQREMVLIQPVRQRHYEGGQTTIRTLWYCEQCSQTIEALQSLVTDARVEASTD